MQDLGLGGQPNCFPEIGNVKNWVDGSTFGLFKFVGDLSKSLLDAKRSKIF